jgi:hypothetical protein
MGADAVAPVIVVGEAASGPAEYGDAKFAKIVDCGFAVAIDVRDGRIFSDPEAAVNAGAEVLGELSMQFGAHDADRIAGVDRDAFGFRIGGEETARD